MDFADAIIPVILAILLTELLRIERRLARIEERVNILLDDLKRR